MIVMEQEGLGFTETTEIPKKSESRRKYGSWVKLLYMFIRSGVKLAEVDYNESRYTNYEVYSRLKMAAKQSFSRDGIHVVMREGKVYLINESKVCEK
jgi:hypothetical protein